MPTLVLASILSESAGLLRLASGLGILSVLSLGLHTPLAGLVLGLEATGFLILLGLSSRYHPLDAPRLFAALTGVCSLAIAAAILDTAAVGPLQLGLHAVLVLPIFLASWSRAPWPYLLATMLATYSPPAIALHPLADFETLLCIQLLATLVLVPANLLRQPRGSWLVFCILALLGLSSATAELSHNAIIGLALETSILGLLFLVPTVLVRPTGLHPIVLVVLLFALTASAGAALYEYVPRLVVLGFDEGLTHRFFPFGDHPNHLGQYLVLTLAVAASLVLSGQWLLPAGLAVILSLLLLLCNHGRADLVSAAALLFLVLGRLLFTRRPSTKSLIVLGVALMTLAALLGSVRSFRVRLSHTFHLSGAGRLDDFATTGRILAEHPLLGLGLQNRAYLVPRFVTEHAPTSGFYRSVSHNYPLSFAAEAGLPVALLLFTLITVLALPSLRSFLSDPRPGPNALPGLALVALGPTLLAGAFLLPTRLLGGLLLLTAAQPRHTRPLSMPLRFTLRALAASLLIYLLCTHASHQLFRELQIVEVGTEEEYRRTLNRALALGPLDHQLRYKAAMAASYPLDYPEREGLLRQALTLAPNFPMYHNRLGILLQEQGRHRDALVPLEHALALAGGHGGRYLRDIVVSLEGSGLPFGAQLDVMLHRDWRHLEPLLIRGTIHLEQLFPLADTAAKRRALTIVVARFQRFELLPRLLEGAASQQEVLELLPLLPGFPLDDALLTAAREREDDPFVANALCLCGLTRGWPADMLTALAQRSLRRWTDLYLDDLPAHLCLALIAARSGDREAFAEQRRILDFLGASILPALHRAEQSDPESLALHQVVLGLTPR